jgi:hypothetical protein
MTFIADRLVRNSKGYPIGRCSFRPKFKYEKGMDVLPMALCEFAKYYVAEPRGMLFYIDDIVYTIPKELNDVRIVRSDPTKIVVNNFSFIKVNK